MNRFKFLSILFWLSSTTFLSCKPVTPSDQTNQSGVMSVGESLSFCLQNSDQEFEVLPNSEDISNFKKYLENFEASGAEACTTSESDESSLGLVMGLRTLQLVIKKLPEGFGITLKIGGSELTRLVKRHQDIEPEIRRLQEVARRSLSSGDSKSWMGYIGEITKKGTSDDALRTFLVPTMQNMTESQKLSIFQHIQKNYPQAYKNKQRFVGKGFAPKRAFDLILRYTIGPEKYFQNVKTSSEAMQAWRAFFSAQKNAVFKGSDFGSYTPDDVLGVAKRMQDYLKAQGKKAEGAEILLKGSFPAGKANLKRRNPLDNPLDSATQGFSTSNSDIDFLINKEWQQPIKSIEANIYDTLVSKQARDIVESSGAKPSFQSHPDPFDIFAELDGSMMSPIGLRVNQSEIKLVIYRALPATELPSRKTIEAMTSKEKWELYNKWTQTITIN